ncbi:MAG: QcrA and Rieske domain-containing protein [Planctomycetota bacterium]|jgi:cytochrome b6-f complex iron-sulfur subunit
MEENRPIESGSGALQAAAVPAISAEEKAASERRSFLVKLGWAGFALFQLIWVVAFARFFFPRALFEPPTTFKVGYPWEFTVGTVDTRFQQKYRVWVVRETEGFYALLAKCTHLGCTPVWWEGENKFKCPCHGSGFTKEGVNYEGPAPRPLERLKVGLAEDGQIVISKSTVFRRERGEWEKPGAFLKA